MPPTISFETETLEHASCLLSSLGGYDATLKETGTGFRVECRGSLAAVLSATESCLIDHEIGSVAVHIGARRYSMLRAA